jgi:hypothetical protein
MLKKSDAKIPGDFRNPVPDLVPDFWGGLLGVGRMGVWIWNKNKQRAFIIA